MVNVVAVPEQVEPPLVKVGVTVIVATTGAVPLFTAVNEAMSPVPLAASPIEGVLLVQLYTVPVVDPLKLTALVEPLAHTTWLLIAFTLGVGLIVIVKATGVPVQV